MNDICKECGLYAKAIHSCISGRGQLDSSTALLLIGEAPGYDENVQGSVFIGRAGSVLNATLSDVAPKGRYFITNAVKCFPRDNSSPNERAFRVPTEHEISCCNFFLANEVSQVDPEKCVLMPMGNTALSALFGQEHEKISKVVGKVQNVLLEGREYVVIPNYHPSYVLRNRTATPIFRAVIVQGFNYFKTWRKLNGLN